MFYKYFTKQLLKNHLTILKKNDFISSNFQLLTYSSLSNLIKYNKEESDKILNIVNNITTEELINYDISKIRSKKVIAHRCKNGDFQNLEELLQIDGFGIRILEKFANSILNNKPKSEKSQKDLITKQANKFTIPLVNDEIRSKCKSCLSLHIGMSSVTWSRIELNSIGPCELTHWQHEDILYKKLHINDLIQRCLYLDYNIPTADCYIFENPQIAQATSPGNADQINISVQKSQLIAMLGYGFSKRNSKMIKNDEEFNENIKENSIIENKTKLNTNLYFMKRFIAARLFNTLVGTEKVSAEQNILELMRTHYNLYDKTESFNEKDENFVKIKGNISIPMNLRSVYKTSDGYQREYLGQSLLLGLSFIRLAILKCPDSIGKLTTRSSL